MAAAILSTVRQVSWSYRARVSKLVVMPISPGTPKSKQDPAQGSLVLSPGKINQGKIIWEQGRISSYQKELQGIGLAQLYLLRAATLKRMEGVIEQLAQKANGPQAEDNGVLPTFQRDFENFVAIKAVIQQREEGGGFGGEGERGPAEKMKVKILEELSIPRGSSSPFSSHGTVVYKKDAGTNREGIINAAINQYVQTNLSPSTQTAQAAIIANQKTEFIYIARHTSPPVKGRTLYKVGRTTDLPQRTSQLKKCGFQIGLAVPVYDSQKIEQLIHSELKDRPGVHQVGNVCQCGAKHKEIFSVQAKKKGEDWLLGIFFKWVEFDEWWKRVASKQ